ncbi:hypothetical protein G6F57_013030 [Rhizopus arrhizus]|uniref:Uncharacterized protein n=1 Tax=Rhizopus oryzae TaxID=64495 RepID=A0A9P6X3W8_RHIOR|nr:hypothetical protein G6F21_012003 [Rhizopus arrhizus]KAG0794628.1 hypothetical protein G6F22_005304 [Rhizopus arrhizus]KAG0805151.1 hypothetical protein G6F20_012139 [Rhizopus arrhizus]KAG0820892.1 hypothetical protein G6F19_012219 [Rhizopus arrhizus]KAG0821465.1 hypothetical protein G6F18_012183 [Rhizopus arrhizus]
MTFQETHVSDNTLSIINTQFQARYSLWTRHCGIVSFSPSFIFSDNLAPEHDRAFRTQVIGSNLHKLDASWSGHSLLSATCCLDPSPSGPGLWRGNTFLARKPAYQQCPRQHLDDIPLKIHFEWNAQKKWDFVKT